MTQLNTSTLCMLVFALVLTGCKPMVERGADADEVAIAFFDRLYNQRDLPAALNLTSENYQAILERYGTVNAISRYLFDMNFDSVEVAADRQGIALYRNQKDTARVQVSFSGVHLNQRVETLRDVVLVREGTDWRVTKVMDVF